MFCASLFLVLGVQLFLVSSSVVTISDSEATFLVPSSDIDWWKTATIYQIYVKSFKDSDNDGYGDIKGIIDNLNYIQDVSAQAIWLSSIFDSPQKDNGYDVKDYKNIWKTLGTLDDFKKLVTEAHKKGLKVIIDFVPNHTSDEHNWFKLSKFNNESHKDYYIWKNCEVDKKGIVTKLPNNWRSVFGGSAWSYDKNRKQCYLHQFLKEQPDLNFRNPEVITEMQDILKFWLIDYSVDGVRIDAASYLYENSNFTDEEILNKNDTTYSGLKHTYTRDQPETYQLIQGLRKILNNMSDSTNSTKIEFTEAEDLKYYGDGKIDRAQFTLDSIFLGLNEKSTAQEIEKMIKNYVTSLWKYSQKYVPNWMLGNHDSHRIASKVGSERVDGLNILTAFLPGVQIVYQGEELGMTNGNVSCRQGRDKLDGKCDEYLSRTRDFERTPFQWSAENNAGFSKEKPWLPIADDYETINVATEKKSPNSHLKIYQNSQKMRQLLKKSPLNSLEFMESLFPNVLYLRRKSNNKIFEYYFNIYNNATTIKLGSSKCEVLVSTIDKKNLTLTKNNELVLQPFESLVVTYEKSGALSLSLNCIWVIVLAILTKL